MGRLLQKHALLGRGKLKRARQGREIWEAVVAEANCLTNCLTNLPDGVEFDPDVYGLSMDVILKAANENRSGKMLDKHIEYSSGSATGKAPQCEALNNVGTKKEHRCSLASLKGSTLCSRHKNSTKEIKRWNEI